MRVSTKTAHGLIFDEIASTKGIPSPEWFESHILDLTARALCNGHHVVEIDDMMRLCATTSGPSYDRKITWFLLAC